MRTRTSAIVSMALDLIHQEGIAKLPVTECFLIKKQTNTYHTNLLSTIAIKVLAVE